MDSAESRSICLPPHRWKLLFYSMESAKSADLRNWIGFSSGANAKQKFWYLTLPLLKPTTIYVVTISVYAGLSMFLESFMLWNGNSSPKNIGLTIVGYLYKRGIEKNDMAKTAAQPKTMESNHKVASVLSTGLFAILCVLIAFPLLAGFFASFQEGREVVMKGMSLNLDFSKMHLDNYKYLFSGNEDSRKYFMWYKNSLILTLITVVLTLLICYFIAYGLTMYKFKLQGFLFFLVIATMCVPFEILMLPLYNEITSLGIINTRAGVILPGLCGASTIFFFKQYMQSLPKELLDAGRIDGCTEYGISVKIMMPITKPAFASMAILCAMGSWNNMLWPMLVFRDTSKFTLQIGLNTLLTPYGNNYNLLIAGSMFGILPILIIYLIFQRYLIDGMTSGAVKG